MIEVAKIEIEIEQKLLKEGESSGHVVAVVLEELGSEQPRHQIRAQLVVLVRVFHEQIRNDWILRERRRALKNEDEFFDAEGLLVFRHDKQNR